VASSDVIMVDTERPNADVPNSWTSLLDRLNRQSVTKHFDAYADVAWDDDAFRIDPDDPVWELAADHPLGATEWYRALAAPTRSRLGLHIIASQMKTGLQFESILKRGLLEFAAALPNGTPEFRYAYHEVIEEAQHSLMFQEFVNRCGLAVPGLRWDLRFGARRVIGMARHFPVLFFVFVLAGEDPIDHVQRTALRSGRDLHPLLERIMRIHVTEEARHLSFARQYVRTNAPTLSWWQRQRVAIAAPFVLTTMAGVMMRPPAALVRQYAIPKATIAEAYGPGSIAREQTQASLRKVRDLLVEVGLVTPFSRRLWRAFGIWEQTPDEK
jgi:hypothetical protein